MVVAVAVARVPDPGLAPVPDLGPVLLPHHTPQAPALAPTLDPKPVRTLVLMRGLGLDQGRVETGTMVDPDPGRVQDMVLVQAGEAARAAVKDMVRAMATARGMAMAMTMAAKTEIKTDDYNGIN